MSSSSHYPAGLENFAAQSLMIEKDITMKGWLLKKSGREKMALTPRGQYDNRYVIIFRGWVYYYKDETSEKPQGSFSLEGFSNRAPPAAEETSSSLPFVFKVYPKTKTGRTWFFAASDQQSMNHWREAFRHEIERYNTKTIEQRCRNAGEQLATQSNSTGPGTNLKGSFSMPEKFNPRHVDDQLSDGPQGRSQSMTKTHRIVSKNSMSSSKSSESRDSLNSFPPDDRMPQSSSEILYEPLESDDYTEHEGVMGLSHDANDPIPSPKSVRYPPFGLPRVPIQFKEPCIYDTIDDENVTSNPLPRPPFSTGCRIPMPPSSTSKPKPPPTPEKNLLHRVSSIPPSDPPEPPKKKYPVDTGFYEYAPPLQLPIDTGLYEDTPTNQPPVDAGFYEATNFQRNQCNTFPDKPLPPLPKEASYSGQSGLPKHSSFDSGDVSVLYDEALDRTKAPMPGCLPHGSTFSLTADPAVGYDDTTGADMNHRRIHSLSCVEDAGCVSKQFPLVAKGPKVLPVPPNLDSKPKTPTDLPLKPSNVKKVEAASSIVTEKKEIKPPTPLKPKPQSKSLANSVNLVEEIQSTVPPTKPKPKTSPTKSNFAKVMNNQGNASPTHIAAKPLPPLGPNKAPPTSITKEPQSSLAKNIGGEKPSSAANLDEDKLFPIKQSEIMKTPPFKKSDLFSGPKPSAIAGNSTKPHSANKPLAVSKPSPANKFSKPKPSNNNNPIAPKPNIIGVKLKPVGPKATSASAGTKPETFINNGARKPSPTKNEKPQTPISELSKNFGQSVGIQENSKTSKTSVSEPDLGSVSARAKMFGGNVSGNIGSTAGKNPPPVLKKPVFKR